MLQKTDGYGKATQRQHDTAIAGLHRVGALEWARRLIESRRMPVFAVLGGSRHPEHVALRHEIVTVVVHTLGLGYSQAARVFGIDHTTVIAIVRAYEAELVGHASEVA